MIASWHKTTAAIARVATSRSLFGLRHQMSQADPTLVVVLHCLTGTTPWLTLQPVVHTGQPAGQWGQAGAACWCRTITGREYSGARGRGRLRNERAADTA